MITQRDTMCNASSRHLQQHLPMLVICFRTPVQRSISHISYIMKPPLPSACSKSPSYFYKKQTNEQLWRSESECFAVRPGGKAIVHRTGSNQHRRPLTELNRDKFVIVCVSRAFCTSLMLTELASHRHAVSMASLSSWPPLSNDKIESTALRWNVALSCNRIARSLPSQWGQKNKRTTARTTDIYYVIPPRRRLFCFR